MEEKESEVKKEYKCKYCGETFGKPLLLAHHVRAKHRRVKKREKKAETTEKVSDQINKTIEAMGILKGLQVSPHLSDEEKRVLSDVSMRIEELLTFIQRSK
ncbi:MAG: hypothetical protein ACXQTW_07070 [Candidatus Methanospirareceae archaeon]